MGSKQEPVEGVWGGQDRARRVRRSCEAYWPSLPLERVPKGRERMGGVRRRVVRRNLRVYWERVILVKVRSLVEIRNIATEVGLGMAAVGRTASVKPAAR